MWTRISLGQGLIRVAISLLVLGCLLVGGTTFSQTAKAAACVSNPVSALSGIAVAGTSDTGVDKAVLTTGEEISAQVDFEFAIEDDVSVEMSRPDVPQRISALDRAVVRPKDFSKAASDTRPSISAPLLE